MDKKIGVYVCECGPNIKERIDIDAVLKEISSIEEVSVVKNYSLLCSNDGKKFLAEEIKNEGITHLVVAACSPREHEQTFMNVCEEAGLNPYLMQMVNIREQCAWIIPDKNEATRMAIKYIRAGIHRVMLHNELFKKELSSNADVLVIGGGTSGIETSLSLAGKKRKVYLVEKEEALGGMAKRLSKILPYQGSDLSVIEEKIKKVENNEQVEVLTSSEVTGARGFLGNFEVDVEVRKQDEDTEYREIQTGAIVVATGFDLYNPKESPHYGYGEIENVLTALEFEENAGSGNIALKNGSPPKSVAIIHCVGRKEKGYCSKVCCLYSMKFARHVKEKIKETEVYEFYTDLCLPYKHDQAYYEETKKEGIHFIREDSVKVSSKNGKINIEHQPSDGEKGSQLVDMVILAPAMIPSEKASKLAEIFNLPLDETGFFKEVHEMLDPVSTPIDGVYITGCALGPKNIPDSIIQSQAVSGKIFSTLIPGKKLEPEVRVSEVRTEFCTGCQTCLSVCFYGAISFDEVEGVSVVNEAICRGCGSCVGSCPSGAIISKHFKYKQLYQEVLEAIV
ncbi:MAG: CoB--CoM heterodisulfide reductase iron-sulfur subunit A family protein [Candidatus Aminicenantaceae bacterium]